jgi:hypothetical protein
MAGADCPIPLQFCALRAARLAADGTIVSGTNNGYVMTDKQISLQFKRVYQDGDEFSVKNGCGGYPLAMKAPRIPKWAEVTLQIATCDPEFLELATDGSLITVSGSSDGYADPPVGAAPGPGISLELWRKAIVNNQQSAMKPWLWTAIPMVILSLDDETYESAPGVVSLSGIAYENSGFGNGPFNDWPSGAISNRLQQFVRSATIPVGSCGYVTTPAGP